MCAQNPQFPVAAKNVPVTIVPHAFSQAPVFLARKTRQRLVESRSEISSFSLALLTSSQFSVRHVFLTWSTEVDQWWETSLPLSRIKSTICLHVENLGTSCSQKSRDSGVPGRLFSLTLYLKFLRWVREFWLSEEKSRKKGFLNHLLNPRKRVSCIICDTL